MDLGEFDKKKAKIPDAPGVYFFLGARKEILYIGKAASLRDRVRSYFSPDLNEARGPVVVKMVEKARSLDWRQTDSVLEALILEANLIKTHKPFANSLAKDDKSFRYVVITKEAFPRVLSVRGKDLPNVPYKTKAVFGPFPHGLQLNDALKIVRRIFPYRDTCTPCVQQKDPKRCKPCFNRQIGLCPGVCSGEVDKEDYARMVRHIEIFFEGKKKVLMRELERDMKRAAKEERFEDAAMLRRQIFAMQHIQDVSLIKREYRAPSGIIPDAAGGKSGSYRIEAYDVAHLRGSNAVGVMVVVEDGETQKSEYRTFHIKEAAAGDDVGALREILSRRFGHSEWFYPRLIVVDGSKAQMNAAAKVLEQFGIQIPIVGVVKDEHHRARGISGNKDIIREREQEILLANNEAHRFVIGRHRNMRRLKK